MFHEIMKTLVEAHPDQAGYGEYLTTSEECLAELRAARSNSLAGC